MADKETEDATVESQVDTTSAKQHGLFGSTGIQLTDNELSSPSTTKFLRHLNTIQENEIHQLRSFQSQYYEKRQDCEVIKKETEALEKELESKKNLENTQKVMITMGSLLLGSLKLLESQPWYVLFILSLISVILIIGGMFPVLRIGASK